MMYLTKRFYIWLAISAVVIACGFVNDVFFYVGVGIGLTLLVGLVADVIMMYSRGTVDAERVTEARWSNGDENKVKVVVQSTYPFRVHAEVVDELPSQLQIRDFSRRINVASGVPQNISYIVTPKERGAYRFGIINVFSSSPIRLVSRRFKCGDVTDVKVYPSFLKLHNYELSTIRSVNNEESSKRLRRIGNATEFEQIKDYMPDDDYRKINWKASARRHQLMVNVYDDEKSQFVYNVIDKGRVMQQMFAQTSLLDYAINASLAVSHIALKKDDNVGLLSFDNHPSVFLQATHHHQQMNRLLNALYDLQTTYPESDFAALSEHINKHVTKRSLIILYTNFFSVDALSRQLKYLKNISRRHRLLVVFFDDNEQNDYIKTPIEDKRDYFKHVIAEKYSFERRAMVTMLRQHGILALLTEPKKLSVDIINKYIDIKTSNLF